MNSGDALSHFLADVDATRAFGARLARALAHSETGLIVSLEGELGAGKTELVRATLHALGHDGPVVSPSYTLIEPYDLAARTARHMDLYRLGDPEELEYLGIREIEDHDLVFIEWAERGTGYLPPLDLVIGLDYEQSARRVHVTARSPRGRAVVAALDTTANSAH